ncbi:MAG: type IV pilus secretin PilQ [Nitrospirae bacterium]|nr:type IV pilus secretin PilQ [Nitrospirota bacterium]
MKPTNVARGAVFLLAGLIGLGSSVGLLGAEEGTKAANPNPETVNPARDSAALERISARADGRSSIVRLDGSGLGEAKAFFADPLRFVIDLPGAQGVVKAPRIEGKSPVQKIRIGRHSGEASKVRIVLDLRGPSSIEEIARTASSIELRVTRDARSRYAGMGSAPVREARAPEAVAPSAVEKSAPEKMEKTEGTDAKPAEAQSAEATVTGGGVQAAAQPPAGSSSTGTESEKTALGASDKGQTAPAIKASDISRDPAKAAAASDQTSVAAETSRAANPKAKGGSEAVLGFKGDTPADASLAASEAPPAATAPESGPKFDTTIGKAGPEFTGKRISLDFQDADIKNVLRLIAEVSGFNLITSDEVQGKVTVKLLNVPWDQALDIILKTKGLGEVREGTIIRVAPVAALTKEQEDAAKRREAEARAEPTITRLVTLSFSRAKEVEPVLKKALSSKGDITLDERTNTLIIRDIARIAGQVAELARTLDKQTPQVIIEARIVEVSTNYLKELGIQWGGHYVRDAAHGNALQYRFPNSMGVASGLTGPGSDSLNQNPTNPLTGARAEAAGTTAGATSAGRGNAFAVNLPATVGLGAGGAIGFTVGSIANIMSLDVVLSALENTGRLKILSNPKIATLDNKEAIIKSGRRIPYETVSQSGTQTQWIDATLELKVVPHITDDRHIDIKIEAKKNEGDWSNSVKGTPSVIVKEASTQLLVRDGDTVVLGGVFKTTENDAKIGLPWLSDIPVLGWLFKKETAKKENEELLIFITPKVLKPASI